MSYLFGRQQYLRCFFLLIVFALSACGGGGGGGSANNSATGGGSGSGGGIGSGPGADPVLQKIVIDTPALMFTSLGEVRSLNATAFNSNGDQVNVALTWASTDNNLVNIDASSGVVTSIANGVTVLTASAEGVTSNPVVAVVAQFQPGVVLIPSDQVLSEPTLDGSVTTPVVYEVGIRFTVSLGSAVGMPQVGSILAANGDIPFAGRVVEVTQDANDNFQTTLEIIAVDDLLANFSMDEVIDVLNLPATINPDLDTYFVVERKLNGEIVLTPRPDSTAPRSDFTSHRIAARPPLGTVANPYHPFVCEASPEGLFDPKNIPIKLELGSNAIKITPDISVPLIYTADRGLEKLALRGEVKAEAKLKFAITAAFEAKFSCSLQIAVINVPLPGALGFLVGAQVPVGIGGEVGGKIKFADVGVEKEASATATVEYGYYNPAQCDAADPGPGDGEGEGEGVPLDRTGFPLQAKNPVCGFDGTVTTKGEIKTNYDRLNTGKTFATMTNDVTLEPKAAGYGFAKLAVGNPYLSALSAELLVFTAGPSLSANLATSNGQILNETYKSNYSLAMEGVLKPGKTVDKALAFFKVGVAAKPEIKVVQPLTTSPKARSLTIRRNSTAYTEGEVLTFTVLLDETSVNFFPGLHNVSDIRIYQKSSDPNQAARLIASASDDDLFNPGDARLKFDIEWTADADGDAKDQFYAFVTTPLLPVPVLEELELGKFLVSNGKIQLEEFVLQSSTVCNYHRIINGVVPCDDGAVNGSFDDRKTSDIIGQLETSSSVLSATSVGTSSVINEEEQGVYEFVTDLSGAGDFDCWQTGTTECLGARGLGILEFYTAEAITCEIDQNFTGLFDQTRQVAARGLPGLLLEFDTNVFGEQLQRNLVLPSDNRLTLDGDKTYKLFTSVNARTGSVQGRFKLTCNAPFE